MPVLSGHWQDSGKGMRNGEGGFSKGPAEQRGHTARGIVGKGGASRWTFRSALKFKKRCLKHLEHGATSDIIKMTFGGDDSRCELYSNSEAEEGWSKVRRDRDWAW